MASNCTKWDGEPVACVDANHQKVEVLAALGIIALLGVALYLVDVHWRKQETICAKAVGVLNEASGFASNLVRHFSPSMKVAKYQFRGMQAPKAPIDITFRELGLSLHSGVKVLNGVSGEFKAGKMCAIMGPSGAGKTTFMNVLCGKATYGVMTGKALINGHNIDIRDISSVVGFVPQDDIVHETLTVREQIRFSAALRNKVHTSKDRIERITDDVLNVMQIDHIQNTVVGGVKKRGISGGQRKRVNIGLELSAQPTVLFLDEPTTGLDSTSSLSVVYSLKKMCQLGMSCIMVIHQPRYSLFTLFDDVLLLGKGGHAVYLGGSLGARDYFENLGFKIPEGENVADWFMDVISGEVPNPSIADFTPKMLFTFWEKYEKGTLSTEFASANGDEADTGRNGHRSETTKGGRNFLTEEQDVAVLSRNLQEEWDRIDNNHDGFLDEDELKALLQLCSNLEPSDEVVEELMRRMSGSKGVVTKAEFIEYLKSMKHDVAHDAQADGESAGSQLPLSSTGMFGNLRRRLRTPPGSREFEAECGESESSSESESDEDAAFTGKAGKAGMLNKLKRQTLGPAAQFHVLMTRNTIQWWRNNPSRLIFFAAVTVGAIVLAGQDMVVGTPKWDAMDFVNTHTCVALLVCIFCLQLFGENQPVFWRERNRGLNVFSFNLSRSNLNLVDTTMMCFLFTATYYILRGVPVGFWQYWFPYLLVAYVASGWGYVISAWFPYEHGPFLASLLMFVVCGIMGNPFNLAKFLTNPGLEAMVSLLSITRWSIPMSYLMQVHVTNPHPEPGQEEQLFKQYNAALTAGTWGDPLGYWWSGTYALATYGTVLRIIALMGLRYRNRDKQV